MRSPCILANLLLFLLVITDVSQAQDCAPLDPRQQISEKTAQDINGVVQTVFKVGRVEGSYKGVAEKEVKNLYEKYPEADKIVLKSQLIYLFCTTLKDSNLSSDKKIKELRDFISTMSTIPNSRSETQTKDKPINVNGIWRDTQYPNNGSRITQKDNSFQFTRWGVLPDGTQFESSGNGTVTGQSITSSYHARYQSGATSTGDCLGTVSPDGMQMQLTCTDSALGTFVFSGLRR